MLRKDLGWKWALIESWYYNGWTKKAWYKLKKIKIKNKTATKNGSAKRSKTSFWWLAHE